MITKSQVKHIQSLQDKKYRNQSGQFVVEGEKMVHELLNSAFDIIQVYVSGNTRVMYELQKSGLKIESIEEHEMKKISSWTTPSHILAIVQIPTFSSAAPKRCFLLDQIRDPGNLGTIIRVADWFGLDAVICSPDTVDAFNPKVVQATMGSLFRVSVNYTPLKEWIQQHPEVPVYAASLDGKELTPGKERLETAALLIGNESNGLSEELLQVSDHLLRIPGRGGAESLNAAVAAGIMAFGLLY